MIIFSLHKRYFHTNIKYRYGKDQSDIFVCGADTRFGKWIQAWSSAFFAPTLPGCPTEVARLEFTTIALKVDLCQQSINKWVDRFLAERIEGLENRPGEGAKPIISMEADQETIRKAIEADRQSMKAAKAAWESSSGKTASDETFRRFLSALAQDIDV
jgi:hypothetical protein